MDIIGYEGLYKIYEDGRVWSIKSNKFLKHRFHSYAYVSLYKDSKEKLMYIHRLIALHYIPNPNNFKNVDHIDRNKLNNNINNLRWLSISENGINTNVRGNIPYRHISVRYKTSNYSFYQLHISRNKRKIFAKSFSCNKYTLEEVVRIRNEKYIEYGIDIDD